MCLYSTVHYMCLYLYLTRQLPVSCIGGLAPQFSVVCKLMG